MTPTERVELRRMGERLIALADGDPVSDATPENDRLVDAAWREISRRKSRKRVVPSELLGEPAWDILLDLFVMPALGKRVSVTSSCIAGEVPPTTGLRWITALVDNGYAVREPDPADARRSFVRLSAKGLTMVAEAMRVSVRAERLTPTARRRPDGRSHHQEIASEVGIGQRTVRMHHANLMGNIALDQSDK